MSRLIVDFLQKNLINIGSDDARLTDLGGAATTLAESLAKTPSLIFPFVMTALDRSVNDEDPTLDTARNAIASKWKLYRSAVGGDDSTLCRAAILQALSDAADKSALLSAAVTLASRNAVQYLDLGLEQTIWTKFLEPHYTAYERTAKSQWAIGTKLPSPIRRQEPDALGLEIRKAIGGLKADGQEFDPPSPQLASGFGDRAQFAEWANAASTNLASLSGPYLSAISQTTKFTQPLLWRSDLLWWQQALYSATSDKSYSEYEPTECALLMATDLSLLFPLYCPRAALFSLRQALLAVSDDVLEMAPLSSFLERIVSNERLKGLIQTPQSSYDKAPLAAVLLEAVNGKGFDSGRLLRSVGTNGDVKLSIFDLACWLFDDLLALRYVTAS